MSRRTIAALIIAPLWVPITVAIFAAWKVFPDPAQGPWVILSTVVAAIVTYIGVTVIGVPAMRILREHNLTGPWSAAALGLLGGALMWAAFGLFFGLLLGEGLRGFSYFLRGLIDGKLIGIFAPLALGALVGLTFWMIARPDRGTHRGPSS